MKVKVIQLCPTLCDPIDYTVYRVREFSRQEYGVEILQGNLLSLLQGIFPTQGSNPGLLHCRQIIYQLSHKGSPRILDWVPYPFSRVSSWPRNPALQADTLPTELWGKPIFTYQFSSVTQSCLTGCDPMNRSTPGLPVHQKLPEFTQTHVHRVGDAIQPSHPLSSPSPPAPNPS